MKKVRVCVAVLALAAVFGLVYSAGVSIAGGDKGPKTDVEPIVAAIKKGDMSTAKTLAAKVAKKYDTVEDVMDLFKTKKKGGWSPWPKETDGIELKIREIARDGLKSITDAPKVEESAQIALAIGLIAEAKAPEKDTAKKSRKEWMQHVQDMQAGSQALAKAAQAKGAADIKKAATQLNNSCNACHSTFRQ
jgi:hypothetical protein